MTPKANMASGCMDQEAWISPWANKFIERPNPHPGHQVNPRFSKGQRLK